MKKIIPLITFLILSFNVKAQGFFASHPTYLDSIYIDSISGYDVKIGELKLTDPPEKVEKLFGKADYADKYNGDPDLGNEEEIYIEFTFGCFNFDDCRSKIFESTNFVYHSIDNNNFELILYESPRKDIPIIYKQEFFFIGNSIDKLKKIFPNSYKYYCKLKKHNYKERNHGIKVYMPNTAHKIYFGIDEKTDTITSISLDPME